MAFSYLIGWSKYNKYYYGARWSKNCSPADLWTTYFTSSKYVKIFREMHGEPDIIQVRKVFDDADKCRMYEYKVLNRLNVLTEEKWLNKNVNGRFLPTGPMTKEHIANRVESFKKNGKRKGYVAWTKESNPEAAKSVSNALKGRPKSKEHIEAMRSRIQDTTSLTCPHCGKTGDYKNMKRWHMDRCKLNPARMTDIDAKTVTCYVCGHTAKQSPNFYRNHNTHCRSQSHKAQ